jgi:hypothetical protein
MKTITIKYTYGLASYLDEIGITFSTKDDFICIYLPKKYTFTDVWKLCMQYNDFREKN